MAIKREDLISSVLNKVRQTFNDNQGWVRQGKFTPKQQVQTFTNKMTDDTGLFRGNKFGVPNFTPLKALGDYSYKGGPTVREAFNKLPEQAQQDWGQAGLVRNNPLLQKFAPKAIEPLATAVELGPAAYMNTWSKGLTTFSRDTTIPEKAWDLLGVYGSLNPAYATKNLASGPLGVGFNAITNKVSGKPALENWKQGWQQGQEFQFHANPINQATGQLVNQLATKIPILQKFTETALKSNIQPTDKLSTAVGKWLSTSGRKVLKAAVLETAVETPIWASMTKTDQETYIEALEREAIQNLVMNVGMAGLNSLGDARQLAPIVKTSIDDAIQVYKNTPPQVTQGGYLNIFGNIVDGTSRTKLFDDAVYNLKENPNATPSDKGQATTNIINLAKRVLTNEEYRKIMSKKSGTYRGSTSAFDDLLDAVGKKIGSDIKTNKGYEEPFTINNLLSNKGKTREEILKSQSGKVNFFGDIDTKQSTEGFPQQNIKLKTNLGQSISPIKTGGEGLIDKKIDLGVTPKTSIDTRNVELPDQLQTTKVQTELPTTNKVLQTNVDQTQTNLPQTSYVRNVSGNAPNFVVDENGNVIKVKNISRNKYGELVPETKTELTQGKGEALPSGKIETPQALPQGQSRQIVVKTRTQLKKVLSENPNANVRIELTPEKGKITTYGEIPTKEEVQSTLPTRINQFTEDVLGFSTKAPKGGARKASLWTRTLRKGQEAVSTKVEQGLASENSLVRNSANFIQNFFRGIGMSPERAKASAELKGSIATANDNGYKVMDSIYQIIGSNKKSLERINAVLDPEIAKTKVTFDQLTDTEKQAYNLLREGFDLVHDTSYANGHISSELYAANKGKYTPRMYETTELPAEVNDFLKQGKRINNNIYKGRKVIDDWKKENSLNDPVYALGKRLSQVQTNTAIKKYTDFLASNERFVSDVPKKGYTKLSDSPTYGSLSGKYVMNSAAEDLKGFFFANQAVQDLYDVFRAYDRMPIRQIQKQLLTVFNPTTNVGNIVSDQVFGFLTGVNPLSLNKNLIYFKNNPAEYKRLSSYLMSKNIVGTDITRTDFLDRLGSIDSLSAGKKPGVISKVKGFYGGTDDVYKTSAFKALLDKGFTLEEATRKVADGFQNYANVGKFYDVAAKTPIIGKPFIKFQGDLIRIIKNGAVNNPLGLITFLGTLKGISYLSSKASGESDEDRKTRENRFAAPMIPGLNIPLTWQTPIGEINVARYISPFYANNETTNIASSMLPFVPNIDTNRDLASNVAMNVNDPLLSPFIQAGINRDFRGKRIADPNETKWQQSTLTPTEKGLNTAKFIGRAYLPPPVNSAIDVGSAVQGKPNMYGTPQTVGQSIARLGGIKISQYGPEEVQEIRDKDLEYELKGNEYTNQQIRSVKKQLLKGEITQEQADKRITNLQSKITTPSVKTSGYDYIDDNDAMRTIDIGKVSQLPEQTAYQRALKEKQKYTLVDDILENLSGDQQIEALQTLGISSEDATYYNTARQENYLKSIYIEEEIMGMIQQGQSKDQILNTLASMRKAVNEKILLSDGVINDLVDKNIISYSDGKALKNIDKDLTPKKTGTTTKKPKKLSLSSKKFTASKKKYNPLKVKSTTTKSRFTPPKYVKADLRTSFKLL